MSLINYLLLLVFSVLLTGCFGDYNRFIDVVDRNNKLTNSSQMTELFVKEYNEHIIDIMSRPEYYGKSNDLDYSIVKPQEVDAKDIKYTYSFNENFLDSKYISYYFIVNSSTNKIINWEFTYCNKRKIDFNDKKSYQQCLKNSRVIKEKNNIYRIGVNRMILKKYGYKKDNYNTKHVDDIQIVTDILNADGQCKNGINKILKKEYWGFEHNVRYYVRCS